MEWNEQHWKVDVVAGTQRLVLKWPSRNMLCVTVAIFKASIVESRVTSGTIALGYRCTKKRGAIACVIPTSSMACSRETAPLWRGVTVRPRIFRMLRITKGVTRFFRYTASRSAALFPRLWWFLGACVGGFLGRGERLDVSLPCFQCVPKF